MISDISIEINVVLELRSALFFAASLQLQLCSIPTPRHTAKNVSKLMHCLYVFLY